MILRSLHLKNFRNYTDLELHPGEGLNILVGSNAQGKSNILESIYMLATSKSPRAGREEELIKWNMDISYISADIIREKTNDLKLEISLGGAEKKIIKINSVRHNKISDLVGNLNAVIFHNSDLEIVRGDPSSRRKFMNIEISQSSPAYCYNLICYKKVLEQRNKLLKDYQKGFGRIDSLSSWDAQLVMYGSRIIEKRLEFLRLIGEEAQQIHGILTNDKENLKITYRPKVSVAEGANAETIREIFEEQMSIRRQDEIIRATTLLGPHRDDITFTTDGMDVRIYGSQGQQRTVVLSLKLAEMLLLTKLMGEAPVMMLDDVMSELDDERRSQILEIVKGKCQTFITCTNLRYFSKEVLEDSVIYEVESGKINIIH